MFQAIPQRLCLRFFLADLVELEVFQVMPQVLQSRQEYIEVG
jgi:hypothetical protein